MSNARRADVLGPIRSHQRYTALPAWHRIVWSVGSLRANRLGFHGESSPRCEPRPIGALIGALSLAIIKAGRESTLKP